MSFELAQSLNERNREDSQDYVKLLLEDARFYKQWHGSLDGWKPKDVYQRTTVFGAWQSPRNDVRGNLWTIVSQIADAEIVSKINEYLWRKEEIQKTVQSQTQEVKKESPQKSDIQETLTPNEELPEIAPKEESSYEPLPEYKPDSIVPVKSENGKKSQLEKVKKESQQEVVKKSDPKHLINFSKKPDSRELSEDILGVQDAYNTFLKVAKDGDKWFSWLRNNEQDIITLRKNLTDAFNKFNEEIVKFVSKGWDIAKIQYMRYNIALYYGDNLEWVDADNQMDIVASQNILLDILWNKISKLPDTVDQIDATLTNLAKTNPQIADIISKKVAEQSARGESINLGLILSNPLVKWAWERAYDAVYGTYLAKLDNELDILKWQKYDTLSDIQKKSLNQLRDIRGKGGIFDFTTQNREQMWQMLKYGSAVVAWVAVTALTGGTASAPMLALGATLGAGVTTTGMILAQGYHGSTKEVAWEFGINLLSFGWGAVIFKAASGAKALALAEKTSRFVVYAGEWVANVWVGVWTDKLRAHLHGEDLDIWSSIQQNLIWAALPFAFRMKWWQVPKDILADAQTVDNLTQAAHVQATLWKPTKGIFEKMKSPLERLKFWGEKQKPASSESHILTTAKGKYDYQIIKNGDETLYFKWAKWSGNFNKKISYSELPQSIKNKISGNNGVKDIQKKPSDIQSKNTQDIKTLVHETEHPQIATKAVEDISHSTKKMKDAFSTEWLEKMSHKLGKPMSWLADQSVGPVFRMITGNNPSGILWLLNPMGGWKGKASTYGHNLVEHWKSPVKNSINLLIAWERKDGKGVLWAVAKNVLVAGTITAADYFAVPNQDANKAENVAQNYYEMILLGWLGIVIMERDTIVETSKDIKNWLSDRIQAKPF